ncbi:MAG: hypothetical protein EBQ97_06220 [Bacteroidetes bacterium]|nr:hypothetical protein [Bacteroidota bacterium]
MISETDLGLLGNLIQNDKKIGAIVIDSNSFGKGFGLRAQVYRQCGQNKKAPYTEAANQVRI